MKGYITNKQCYIFPQTGAQIPEVEADVFYVQPEEYAVWVEENESIASKIEKYNYNTMTVKAKVWSGHENDDLVPTPAPTGIVPTGAQPTGVEPEPTGAQPTGAEPEPTGAEAPTGVQGA